MAVSMRKEPGLRLQRRAGSQLGTGTGAGAAQMASEVPAMAPAKFRSSVHVAVGHSPKQQA